MTRGKTQEAFSLLVQDTDIIEDHREKTASDVFFCESGQRLEQ